MVGRLLSADVSRRISENTATSYNPALPDDDSEESVRIP